MPSRQRQGWEDYFEWVRLLRQSTTSTGTGDMAQVTITVNKIEKPPPMRLVERHDTYNTYRQRGQLVHLLHGPRLLSERTQKYRLADIDVDTLAGLINRWWTKNRYNGNLEMLRDYLRGQVVDPENADRINGCATCGGWRRTVRIEADLYNGAGTQNVNVCDTCLIESFRTCSQCALPQWRGGRNDPNLLHYNAVQIRRNYTVCRDHYDDLYQRCGRCQQHVRRGRRHECGCNCEAKEQTFTIPNGDAPLANDTMLELEIAAGEISDVGIRNIGAVITDHFYNVFARADRAWRYGDGGTQQESNIARDAYDKADRLIRVMADRIGRSWSSREGNFTKRLSRLAYKEFGLKLPPEVLTQVGNLATEHSKGTNYRVEFTRHLNQAARQFMNAGSCWWGGYSDSRCTFKSHGGLAMRTFDERGQVTGRAWVMPMRKNNAGRLVPTLDTTNADAWVVFNGYGILSGFAPARILAYMTGLTYQRIEFYNGNNRYLYVNGVSGYLVAPQALMTHVSVRVDLRPHEIPAKDPVLPGPADFVLMA